MMLLLEHVLTTLHSVTIRKILKKKAKFTDGINSLNFLFMAQQPLVGKELIIIEALRSHSDTQLD